MGVQAADHTLPRLSLHSHKITGLSKYLHNKLTVFVIPPNEMRAPVESLAVVLFMPLHKFADRWLVIIEAHM